VTLAFSISIISFDYSYHKGLDIRIHPFHFTRQLLLSNIFLWKVQQYLLMVRSLLTELFWWRMFHIRSIITREVTLSMRSFTFRDAVDEDRRVSLLSLLLITTCLHEFDFEFIHLRFEASLVCPRRLHLEMWRISWITLLLAWLYFWYGTYVTKKVQLTVI
jgi:hypothetical protein